MCRYQTNDGSTLHLDHKVGEVSNRSKTIDLHQSKEEAVHTSMLQERANHREVEVVACNHDGQSKTQTIADELHGYVVNV